MDPAPHIVIAPVLFKDLDHIMEIERRVFPDPWSRNMFLEELLHPDANSFKAIVNQELAGYIFLHRIFDEWALLNLAVGGRWRRQGIATALLNHVVRLARIKHLYRITLEVSEKNQPAIDLYKKFGFQQIGRRPRYYQYNQADALVMELLLGEEAPG
jgi:ribosomal-protein-alanine N-acetyltransferase